MPFTAAPPPTDSAASSSTPTTPSASPAPDSAAADPTASAAAGGGDGADQHLLSLARTHHPSILSECRSHVNHRLIRLNAWARAGLIDRARREFSLIRRIVLPHVGVQSLKYEGAGQGLVWAERHGSTGYAQYFAAGSMEPFEPGSHYAFPAVPRWHLSPTRAQALQRAYAMIMGLYARAGDLPRLLQLADTMIRIDRLRTPTRQVLSVVAVALAGDQFTPKPVHPLVAAAKPERQFAELPQQFAVPVRVRRAALSIALALDAPRRPTQPEITELFRHLIRVCREALDDAANGTDFAAPSSSSPPKQSSQSNAIASSAAAAANTGTPDIFVAKGTKR